MLFKTNKNAIFAIAMVAATLGSLDAVAREAEGGGWAAAKRTPVAVSMVRPQLDVSAIEPAAGGRLVLAAAPQPLATPRPAAPASAGKRLGTFASVAISAGKLPAASKWRNATSADFAPLFTERCARSGLQACQSSLARSLRAARSTAAGEPALAAIGTVNAAVNGALRYSSDKSVWGMGDYWATPTEIAGKGAGDCEDFAITKYWLLRSLGYGAEQLQLVVLLDTRKGVYHAVLAVHLDGRRYILDNLSSRVATDAAFPSYMPIMSFVGGKSYIHGFENKRSETAGMPKDLTAVLPGEGV